VYIYFNNQPKEKHYDILIWLIHHYPDLEIEWLDMFEDIRDLMPYEKNIAACEDFSAWYSAKFPDEYAKRFELIERDLYDYYIHTQNLAKLRERVAFISNHPVPAIDTLTTRLLFQLIYHGYCDDALDYALAVWKPLHDSDKLFGNPELQFTNTI